MAVKKVVFPEWARIVYRGVRGAAIAALTQTLVLQVNWTNPQQALKTLGVSFLSGFLAALGMWLRDNMGETSLVSKVMPI